MEKAFKVKALLHTVKVAPMTVKGRNGEKPVFLLTLIQRDQAGRLLPPDEYVVPPSQLVAMSGLFLEVMRAHSLEAPMPSANAPDRPQ